MVVVVVVVVCVGSGRHLHPMGKRFELDLTTAAVPDMTVWSLKGRSWLLLLLLLLVLLVLLVLLLFVVVVVVVVVVVQQTNKNKRGESVSTNEKKMAME